VSKVLGGVGDHAPECYQSGVRSIALWFVRRVWLLPFAAIT
jgi:hypothetical protein